MEKIKEIIREIKQYEHSFYCDECGKYLGTSKEYSDGWYEKLGEFEVKIHIGEWHRLKKCLCNKCQCDFVEKMKKDLYNLGFVKS